MAVGLMSPACRLMVHDWRQRDLARGRSTSIGAGYQFGMHDPFRAIGKTRRCSRLPACTACQRSHAWVYCQTEHDLAGAAFLLHMMPSHGWQIGSPEPTSFSFSALEMLSSMASSLCLLSFRLMMMRSNCVAAMYMAYLPAAPVLPENVRAVSCTQLPGQSLAWFRLPNPSC